MKSIGKRGYNFPKWHKTVSDNHNFPPYTCSETNVELVGGILHGGRGQNVMFQENRDKESRDSYSAKEIQLRTLSYRIKDKECSNCPRMQKCEPVFSLEISDLSKPIMFIAEAPGRLGAEISRIPLRGDQSGDNFEELLESICLTREECFNTNAVLCLPLDSDEKNDSPKESEIRNCSGFLRSQIDLVHPKIIITLGKSALLALRKIKKHDLKLPKNQAVVSLWNGYHVLPLYHPSPKVMNIHRKKEQQLQDFQVLKNWLIQHRVI